MKKLNTLICALTLTCATLSHAGLITIVSGSSWHTTKGEPQAIDEKKWFDYGYNDSSWKNAYATYPNSITTPDDIYDNAGPGSFSGSRDAELMWHWDPNDPENPTTDPTGINGAIEAYFRLEFSVPDAPPGFTTVINSAKTYIIADDYFELYVNGNSVMTGLLTDHLDEGQPEPVALDLMTACVGGCIHPSDNVLAIYAYDGYESGPQNRLNEWLFFHSEIEFTQVQVQVPEPGNISLFAIGLLGLVLSRKLARS